MALDLSTFFDITTQVAAGGVPLERFGRGLLITEDDALSAGGSGKVQLYTTLNGFSADFDAGDAMDAATVWFSADPIPQGLWVGRWAATNVSTSLRGGTPAVVTDFSLTNYSFAINGMNISPIDLSTAGTYDAIATAIQTALAGVVMGATVTHAADTGFTITLADASVIDPPYLTTAMAGTPLIPVGADLVPLLAMGETDAPLYRQGHDTESVADAATEMVGFATSGAPVAIMLADDAPLTDSLPATGDTRENLAAWASAGDYVFFQLDTSDQALVAGDATSVTALAFSRNQGQVAATYGKDGTKPDVGLAAFQSAQRLDNAASIATAHLKAIPGVEATDITATQYAELKRKRASVVTMVGGLSSLAGASTSRAGYWLDAQWWLLWLKNRTANGLFNAARGSRRLTPGIMYDTLTEVARAGVSNGGIMPGGTVNAQTKADIIATTGNQEFNGVLTAGYLIWVERPSQATAQSRENRIGRFKEWLAPAPAIHEVMGDIILSG